MIEPGQPFLRHTARTGIARRAGLALASGLLLVVSACGFDAQTLAPYTPAAGVNVNVGDGPNGQAAASTIQVRGLLILSSEAGQGFLSGSLYTQGSDALTGVSGYAIKPDGSQGAPIVATISDPVMVTNGNLVVLTDRQPITLTSSDLAPGLSANLTLTFADAGAEQVLVPIGDATVPPYNTISPSPSPSASPSS